MEELEIPGLQAALAVFSGEVFYTGLRILWFHLLLSATSRIERSDEKQLLRAPRSRGYAMLRLMAPSHRHV